MSCLFCFVEQPLDPLVSLVVPGADRLSDGQFGSLEGTEESPFCSQDLQNHEAHDAGVEPVGGAPLPRGPARHSGGGAEGHSGKGGSFTLLPVR